MSNRNKILLTGSSGFIGRHYLEHNSLQYDISPVSLQTCPIEDIEFNSIKTVVHLAGIAHRMEKIDDQIYFDVNHKLTVALASAAKEAGVSHFVFMSTVKVYGDNTKEFLDLSSSTLPTDPYGKSKLDAEKNLLDLANEKFKVAIIRPPLVYGPGVKGNLIRFLKLADGRMRLPFKNIENKRSMVSIDNLIALINKIIESASEGIFIAGDKQPISTSQLLNYIYKAANKKPQWFTMPKIGLWILNKLKPDLYSRLYGSYIIDNTESNKKLNFTPPYETEDGIRKMTQWYLNSTK